MSSRSIEIIVAPDGGVSIDAIGFKGADCEQATKFLEQALGFIKVRQKKPEYTQRARNQNKQQLRS